MQHAAWAGEQRNAPNPALYRRWMRGLYPRTAAATSSAKVLGTRSKTWMPPTDNCPCPRRPPRAHVAEATAERPLVAHGGGTRTGAARRPSGAVTTGGGRRPPGEAGRHTVRLDEPPAWRQPKRRRPPPERVRSAAGGAEPRGPPTHTPALAAPTLVARGGAAPAPPLFPVPYPSSESAMCAGGPLGGRPRSLTCPGWCRHRPHLIFLGSVAARSSPPTRARAAVPAQPRGRGGRQCRLSGALPRRAAAALLVGAAQSSARGRRRPGRLPPFSAFFSVFFGGWGGDHPSLRAGVGVCAAPPLSGALPRLPLGVSRAPAGVGVDGGATHSGRRCALRLGWRGCAD